MSKKLQVRYRVCTATKKFPKSNIPRIFGTFEDGSNLLMNAIQFKRPLAVVRQLLKTGLYKLDARANAYLWKAPTPFEIRNYKMPLTVISA